MLLFHDGFDHYATAEMAAKWTSTGGTITSGSKRNGTNGLHNPTLAGVTLTNASGATFIAGFAIRWASFAANMTIMACTEAQGFTGSCQVGLIGNVDGTVTLRRNGTGGTILAGPSSWVPTTGVFYYLEIKVVISDTVGTVEVLVDGETILSATGLDTQQTSNSTWNGFVISNNADYDDLYICDGSGALNNDFLGDCISESLIAQADSIAAGFNHGLTRSTGSDQGANVDDATPNGDTDYNSGSAAGVKDTYNFPSMTSTGAVLGIQTLMYARKTDQATKTVRPVLRTSATDFPGTTVNIPVGYSYLREVHPTNPNTSAAWTGADITALQAGLEIVS